MNHKPLYHSAPTGSPVPDMTYNAQFNSIPTGSHLSLYPSVACTIVPISKNKKNVTLSTKLAIYMSQHRQSKK